MKERILDFLRKENKTSAQFAEEIGVQPSGISHILSGRNKPSLDFIIKMLEKYPFISTEWILFGKGTMYKERAMIDLFDNSYADDMSATLSEHAVNEKKALSDTSDDTFPPGEKFHSITRSDDKVRKIVWFYENGSFEVFYPSIT